MGNGGGSAHAMAAGAGQVHKRACSSLPRLAVSLISAARTARGRRSPPRAAEPGGRLPLRWAAAGGHVAVARLLLQAAPAAATAPAVAGWLPIHWAVLGGHEAMVRLLLEAAPATGTAATPLGRAPLRLALEQGQAAAARALLGAGPCGRCAGCPGYHRVLRPCPPSPTSC